ncbi:MAG: hypothetical protein KAT68_17100 [Bacteroidales bacterium]|nr:hypothetical protein [Bacteroidales bacterium]
MKIKVQTIKVLSLIIVISVFVKCSPDGSKSSDNDSDNKELIIENEDIGQLYNETYFRFPSPEEIFNFISKTQLIYKEGLVNPNRNKDKYINTLSQSLNLGIYSSDLAYLTLLEKHNESLDYFEATYYLSEKLRISSAFNEPIIERVKKNLDNVDSLIRISNDAYKEIVDYLTNNNKEKTLALMSIGGFIESMHIAVNMVEKYNDDNPIIQSIADQKFALENLYLFAKQYKDDENVSVALELLYQLKTVYNEIEEVNVGKTKLEKTKDNKLVLSGGVKLKMSSKQFSKLKEIITQTRNKIVNNQLN